MTTTTCNCPLCSLLRTEDEDKALAGVRAYLQAFPVGTRKPDELRFVQFNCGPGNERYAVDVYADGTRVFCGNGWHAESMAYWQASQFCQVAYGRGSIARCDNFIWEDQTTTS